MPRGQIGGEEFEQEYGEMCERFDGKFGERSELGDFMVSKYGTQVFHLKVAELIKDFIMEERQLAVKEERAKILKEIESHKNKTKVELFDVIVEYLKK